MGIARTERPIAKITVGRRHRRDLGDIDALAADIADIGLLHPIVVTPKGELVAGKRRLEAWKRLGRSRIPVTVVELDAIVRGELAENAYRKNFTLSEMVAIAASVEKRESELAKARQTASLKRGDKKPVGESFHHGKTRDKIAAPLGISGKTLEKARAVVDAAKADPKRFGKLLEDMDRTGRVNGVYKRLCVARQAAQIRAEPPPLPGHGPYRVIVADVPWPYEVRDEDPSHRAARPYPTMTLDAITAMGPQIQKLAHRDAILWFWVTNSHMPYAFDIVAAWGFEHLTILTWVKDRMGLGDWLRTKTEHVIFAVRGKPIVTLTDETTVLNAPARGHSVKPVEFYDLVEKLCPAPRYADIFSRYRHNKRWDCHGDEAPAISRKAG